MTLPKAATAIVLVSSVCAWAVAGPARAESPPSPTILSLPPPAPPGQTTVVEAGQPRQVALAGVLVTAAAAASPPAPVGQVAVIAMPSGEFSAADLAAGYVDPSGGHARVRPIETANPYRPR